MAEVLRNVKGQWLPGQKSPNPRGAPKGKRLTTQLKEALQRVALEKDGKERTYADLLVERILNKAIVEGHTPTIALIWAHLEGRPVARTSFAEDKEFEQEVSPKLKELADKLRTVQVGRLHKKQEVI